MRERANHAGAVFGEHCRRAVNLWAPAPDPAFVADGVVADLLDRLLRLVDKHDLA